MGGSVMLEIPFNNRVQLRRALMIVFVFVAAQVAGCASSSGSIDAAYVSPLKYNSYTCSQLEQEYARLLQRSGMANKQQDGIASGDTVAMTVGLILFWPALFFIDTDDKKEEVARLKGELDAVEQAAIQKDCAVVSKRIVDGRAAAKKRAEKEADTEPEF